MDRGIRVLLSEVWLKVLSFCSVHEAVQTCVETYSFFLLFLLDFQAASSVPCCNETLAGPACKFAGSSMV